jgi:hypothetical protein
MESLMSWKSTKCSPDAGVWQTYRKKTEAAKNEWVLFDKGTTTLGYVPFGTGLWTAHQFMMTGKPPYWGGSHECSALAVNQ